MTEAQRQCVSSVGSQCICDTGAVVRGIHIRRIKEDLRLQTQGSAIAGSFYQDPLPNQEPTLKTSFGIIQEIISIDMVHSEPQVFLKVKWYKQSIVAEDARIRNVPLFRG